MKPTLKHTAILRRGKIGLPKNVFIELYDDHLEICDLKTGTIVSRTGLVHIQDLKKRLQKLSYINQGERYNLLFAKYTFGITWAGPLFYYMNSRVAHIWEQAIRRNIDELKS